MIETIETLEDYLRWSVEARNTLMKTKRERERYGSMEEYVLEVGEQFDNIPTKHKIRHGPQKLCFQNATQQVFRNDSLVYAEGYAWSVTLPLAIHHAWCVVRETKAVIDVTWRKQGTSYFGVPFDTQWVKKFIADRQYFGVIDVWESEPRWPLLRKVYLPEEYRAW